MMSNSLRLYRTVSDVIVQTMSHLCDTQRENLSWLIAGMFLARHVQLAKVAGRRPGRAQQTSKARQLRRWLANGAIDVRCCYRPFAASVLGRCAGGRVRLLIDTLELPGRRQVLMIALAYRRRSIPLIWEVRRRKGVHNAEMVCALLEALRPWLPDDTEIVLIGDGEFHSVDIMDYVKALGWHYRLRLHSDTQIRLPSGEWVALQDIELAEGQRRYLQDVYITKNKCYGPVNLALWWQPGEDTPWYIATDQPADYYTLLDYSRRMWIEEMFGDFEGGTFQLQLTRLYQPDRLSRLILALAIVYAWLMHTGAWMIKRAYRKLVDRTDRRDRSIPHLGRLWLRRCLINDDPLHIGFTPYVDQVSGS
jgi:hypothetical protein